MSAARQKSSVRLLTLRPRYIADDEVGKFDASLDKHFLANRSLTRRKVASLLLSASFGANALLYAVFLGYLMGLWALIVQAAWTLSFYLLARYVKQVYAATSLHEFLGRHFGTATRRVAAVCSILGILYFTGWEIAVARTSLESLASLSAGSVAQMWKNVAVALLVLTIAVALFYTVVWGRRASGVVNTVLNGIKIVCLVLVTLILAGSLMAQHALSASLFFPSFSEAVKNVGLIAFITNLIFNISWQFVDNSSWQSISSSRATSDADPIRTIRLAGLITFFTVNGMGTILGALMRGNNAVDSNNALGYVAAMAPHLRVVSLCAMIILLAFSAMSLFDGAILSVTQAALVDLRGKWRFMARATLLHARVATFCVGVLAAWGVSLIIDALGGSIFNFVYVVIVLQLSLAGPVLLGLLKDQARTRWMWLAIVLGVTAGIAATIIGSAQNNQLLIQGAGTLTTFVSIVAALGLCRQSSLAFPKD